MPAFPLTHRAKVTALIAVIAALILALAGVGIAVATAGGGEKPGPSATAAVEETDEQAGDRLLKEAIATLEAGDPYAAEEQFARAYDAYVRAGIPEKQEQAWALMEKTMDGRPDPEEDRAEPGE